jgi:toxin ParE1/3/4
MMRLELTERARRDMQEARLWYETQGAGLGNRLYSEIVETIDRVMENPLFFTEWRPGIRGARCNRFPYRVCYRIREDGIRVLAVYHLHRDPDRWDDPDR